MIKAPRNKTFCPLPWVHQMITTDGTIKACCNATKPLGHSDDLSETWNSEEMKDMRSKMILGQEVEGCGRCYEIEELGRKSNRIRAIDHWGERYSFLEVFEKSIGDSLNVASKPLFLDIRFGNLCNLMCKMCGGFSSSQIVKDNARLKKSDPKGYERFVNERTDYVFDWYKNPDVWDDLKGYVPHIEKIYLTGGEPTLIEENLVFLQYCIDQGFAPKITLQFNSNMTNIPPEFLDVILHFKKVIFTCSIDGSFLSQEYIRYPSKWDVVCKNLKMLWDHFDYGKITFSINVVGQLMNVLELPKIFDDLIALHQSMDDPQKHQFGINIESLTEPAKFRIQNAPPNVKRTALARIVAWKEENPQRITSFYHRWKDVDAVINQLTNEPVRDFDFRFVFNQIKFRDSNKKAKLETHLPELHDMLVAHINETHPDKKVDINP